MNRYALTLLISLLATPALTLPAPMPDQELMDKSDHVAVLRLIDVKKGDAQKGDEVLVTWRAIPKDVVGPWTVNYYPGEVVLTHLVKRSGGVSYGSTWWNAKGDDIKAPESTDLPETPG